MELNIEVGAIVEDWYNINSKKEYIVTKVPVSDKKYEYALVGMNGQVYLDKLFGNLKEIVSHIDSQDSWEVKQPPVTFSIQKDWNIQRSYGKHHTLETVLGVTIHAHQLKKTNPPQNEKMSFFITS